MGAARGVHVHYHRALRTQYIGVPILLRDLGAQCSVHSLRRASVVDVYEILRVRIKDLIVFFCKSWLWQKRSSCLRVTFINFV